MKKLGLICTALFVLGAITAFAESTTGNQDAKGTLPCNSEKESGQKTPTQQGTNGDTPKDTKADGSRG